MPVEVGVLQVLEKALAGQPGQTHRLCQSLVPALDEQGGASQVTRVAIVHQYGCVRLLCMEVVELESPEDDPFLAQPLFLLLPVHHQLLPAVDSRLGTAAPVPACVQRDKDNMTTTHSFLYSPT